MKLLYLRTPEDEGFLPNFQRLTSLMGHKVVSTATPQVNVATVATLCKKHSCDAVICGQQQFLKAALHDLPDFFPPIGGNGKELELTLDDYAGSLIKIRGEIDCLIINPIERLVTVAYEKYILNRYLSKLTKPEKWFKQTAFKWRYVKNEADGRDVIERLESARLIGIDIETDSEDNEFKVISCVSYTAYFSGTHTTESYVVKFEEEWQYRFIQRANQTEPPKVFQNGSYDNSYFLRWNCPVFNWLHDTQHLFHSWYSELPKRLDFVTSFALRNIRFWKDDSKSGDSDALYRYCALDSWATVNSYLSLANEAPDWAIANYFQEFPLVFPGLNAAMEGLDIDIERFRKECAEAQKEVIELRTRITKLLDCEPYIPGDKKNPGFNPNSSQQMLRLFTLLGQGHLGSTAKPQMLKAKAAHPLNDHLLTICTDYREQAKLLSNYFNEKKLWNGRLYYAFNAAATDTARLNSTESAFWCGFQIQNVPRGDSVKSCIVPPKGWRLGEADKAQSEARCVGYLSGEESLISLVESEHDYHAWNASAFFGVPYEQIYDEKKRKTLDKELRDLSKRTNHGANYNMGEGVMLDTMGPKKVAQAKRLLKLPGYLSLKEVCAYLLRRYDETYPKVRHDWYTHIVNTIVLTKKLVSAFGWTRYFFADPSKDKRALNAAVAHSPQNLSVSIINREWYKIWRETVYGCLCGRVRIKAQIHDSLLFIFRALEDAKMVHAMMDTKVDITDPQGITRTMFIPSDLSVGKEGKISTWAELKD